MADALVAKLHSNNLQVRILVVGSTHTHILMQAGEGDIKPVVGRAKQAASLRIRAELPGTVWAQGCDVTRIRDESHYLAVVKYIDDHRREGALVCTPASILPRSSTDMGLMSE